MTSIYFVRHAQSDHNDRNERTRPLTAEGTADSKEVAVFLKDRRIDLLISSPYKRSMDTIAELSGMLGLRIHTDEDLRERDPGGWLGNDFRHFIEMQWKDFNYHIEDGECLGDVQNRNIRALANILKAYKDKNIVIATHGSALGTILNYYCPDFGFDSFMRMVGFMPYVVRLDFEDDKCICIKEELIIDKGYKSA